MNESLRWPDQVEEIVGFRAWRIEEHVTHPPTLHSINVQSAPPWPFDDWLVATCVWADYTGTHYIGEEVPAVMCTCGIYAARDRLELARQWGYNTLEGVAIGEVGLAGKVILGTLAHRAQKARVRRLFLPHDRWQLADRLSEAYGVPVDLTNLLAQRRTDGDRTAI